jgi:hypothetical protein
MANMPGCFKTYAARCPNICILARQILTQNAAFMQIDHKAEAVARIDSSSRLACNQLAGLHGREYSRIWGSEDGLA